MVLKEPKMYRQVIWLSPETNQVLQDFIRKLDHEWPMNSTISQVLHMALLDTQLSARFKSELDRKGAAKKPTAIRNAVCRFCQHIIQGGHKELDYHEVTCKKRPLEVIVR